jgi:hypothetical protein
MKPNRLQRLWLKQHLPKDAQPVHLIPRSYVIAKPASGVAVCMTPPADHGEVARSMPENYQGEVVHGWHGEVFDLKQGDWVSLVYAVIINQSQLWYATPMIPWGKIKKEDLKNAVVRKPTKLLARGPARCGSRGRGHRHGEPRHAR